MCSDGSDEGPSDVEQLDPVQTYDAIFSESPPKAFLLGDCKRLSRSEVNEYVLALEKANPVADPAYSNLLNGVWEVISTGFGSPAMLGFQAIKAVPAGIVDISDVSISISSIQPRCTASTTLSAGPLNLDVSVTTDIEAVTAYRLKESYIAGKVNGIELPISSITTFTRDLIITYLDEDLLISRDQFGSPEILRRVSDNFPLRSS